SVFAGYLEFTTNVFEFGQEDNTILVDSYTYTTGDEYNIEPSLMNEYEGIVVTNVLPDGSSSTANDGEGRITVTRMGGAAGRIQVDLTLTNDWYTNTLTTNAWVTNIMI